MEKTKKNNLIFNIITAIFLVIFCFAITPITFQNDTFYTIKIGELISENGIDMQDHFSWHENLEYTYPHWLFDLFTYKVYATFGNVGIYLMTCVFSSILGLCIYFCNYNLSKNNVISFVISILTMYLMTPYITARAQIVTFSLFVLTLFLIEKFIEKPKIKYGVLLILISTLIVNLHVATWPFFFIIFLPYIGEQIIVKIYTRKNFYSNDIKSYMKDIKKMEKKDSSNPKIEKYKNKISELEEKREQKIKERNENLDNTFKIILKRKPNVKWLLLIMLICLFTGFITPLGAETSYTYLIKTMIGDSTQNISEHLPTVLISNIPFLVYTLLLIGILIFTKQKIQLSDLFLICGLSALSIASRRQTSMLVALGSFSLVRLTHGLLIPKNSSPNKITEYISTHKIVYFYIFVFVVCIASEMMENNFSLSFVDEEKYPVSATNYILENIDLTNAKLFNEYVYGSYLLLNDIPVFIDSRCDLYTPEFNEKCTVFDDFIEVLNGKVYFEELFEKYGITHALLPKDSLINIELSGAKSSKYTELYSDDYFVLYQVITENATI